MSLSFSLGAEIAKKSAPSPPPEGSARRGWLADPFTWLSAALAVGAIVGLVQLAGTLLGSSPGAVPEIRGVRFGATATQVRERFDAPGPGRWRSFDEGDVRVLRWEGEGAAAGRGSRQGPGGLEPGADPPSAGPYRFEFHAGVLVAVRATIPAEDPWGEGASLETTPGVVLTREPNGTRVDLTILSRDCPAHAEEVERLLTAP